jgi:hypothetical protein
MALYDRILERDDSGNVVANKIPVHQLLAVIIEFKQGRLTADEASTIVNALTGAGLSTSERTELTTLVATIPSGSTTANIASRAHRLLEIEHILGLGDTRCPGYDTPTNIRSKLGVT